MLDKDIKERDSLLNIAIYLPQNTFKNFLNRLIHLPSS